MGDSSKCCFQLFGYDFMVDANFTVWLLEVNDIPMMHASGPVTERLCDTCLREVVGLVIDGEEHRPESALRFERIYSGAFIRKPKPDGVFTLTVTGTGIPRPHSMVMQKSFNAEDVKLQRR